MKTSIRRPTGEHYFGEHESAHPHICIKACGAAALTLAAALIPVPGVAPNEGSEQLTAWRCQSTGFR
jgi:hypothetical protein